MREIHSSETVHRSRSSPTSNDCRKAFKANSSSETTSSFFSSLRYYCKAATFAFLLRFFFFCLCVSAQPYYIYSSISAWFCRYYQPYSYSPDKTWPI